MLPTIIIAKLSPVASSIKLIQLNPIMLPTIIIAKLSPVASSSKLIQLQKEKLPKGGTGEDKKPKPGHRMCLKWWQNRKFA